MKILYLHQYFNTPSMSGGTRSYEMARRLVAWGHEVHMITTDREGIFDPKQKWHQTDEAGIHVHWTPIPYSNKMSYGQRIKAFFAFSWRAARKAAKIGGDVVFATSTPLTIAIPGVYASKRLKIPMVFEVRDLWPEVPIALGALKNPLTKSAARWLERFAYRNSSHIVALSPDMEQTIVHSNPAAPRISVIPNSSDIEFFSVPPETGEKLRDAYAWLGERPLVLYAGAFGTINGVAYLAHLASETKKLAPEIRFLAIGDGKEWSFVEKTASDLKVLGDNFFMMRSIPKIEIPGWFSAATITTSLVINVKETWKNSANKFFDSFAAGKPIAINYKGWQEKVLNESNAGIVLDPKNLQLAASALVSKLQNTKWLLEASQNAKNLALGVFNRDELAKKMEKMLMDEQKTWKR